MIKTLLKKQLKETASFLFTDRKTGYRKSTARIMIFVALLIFIAASMGFSCYMFFSRLATALVGTGAEWFYFTTTGLVTVLVGVFGNVFTVNSALYLAKDNEFLLSMPIKPSAILFARIAGIWLYSLLYELIVFLPAVIAWQVAASFSALTLLMQICVLFLISLFVMALSLGLGYLVAKISVRLKNKSVVSVIVSLALVTVFYFFYFRAITLFDEFLKNAGEISGKFKAIYPLYALGAAAVGDGLSLLAVFGINSALFTLCYFILAKSFAKIAIDKKAGAKAEKNKGYHVVGLNRALLKREAKRFVSSSAYMLNAGIGVLFIPAVFAAAAIYSGDIIQIAAALTSETGILGSPLALVVALAFGMCSSMIAISAPCVSLEGKGLWLIRSLPVPAKKIIGAKFAFHALVAGIPMAVFSAATVIVLKIPFLSAVLAVLFPVIAVMLVDATGLYLDVKSPNLNWTSQNVPIKQNSSVMVISLGGMGVFAVFTAIFFAVKGFMSPTAYLAVLTAVLAVACAFMIYRLFGKGVKTFETL